MSDEARIGQLEHRVRELQTAVLTIIDDLDIASRVEQAERARLDELKVAGHNDAPRERLIELYGARRHT